MEKNDSDTWTSRVFYLILSGCVFFMLAVYIFAFNS